MEFATPTEALSFDSIIKLLEWWIDCTAHSKHMSRIVISNEFAINLFFYQTCVGINNRAQSPASLSNVTSIVDTPRSGFAFAGTLNSK